MIRRVVFVAVHAGSALLLGGLLGLVGSVAATTAWLALGLRASVFWGAAVALMAAAPFATIAQGLPSRPVVGAMFGATHWLAHALATLSLVLAGFAGGMDLMLRAPREEGSDGGLPSVEALPSSGGGSSPPS
ncbi:MAG: hypothetical protein HY658_14480 [Actinobacteria bacterium]|nr:hypothetical protein [Actinomycetota bacterium]